MFNIMASSIGYINAGRLRALAVTTTTRSDALSKLVAIAKFVPGYEASTAGGIGAPGRGNQCGPGGPGHPRAHLANLGAVPAPTSPAEFGKVIGAETEKWAKVIEFAGVKAA